MGCSPSLLIPPFFFFLDGLLPHLHSAPLLLSLPVCCCCYEHLCVVSSRRRLLTCRQGGSPLRSALLALCVPVVVDALHRDISSQEILVILSASLWQLFQTAMTDYCWLLSACTIMMCTHPSPTVSASTESIHKDMDIKEFYELSLPIQMYQNYVSICIIIAIY